MLFNSAEFLLFLPVVLLGYYALSHRAQTWWLLAASYVFYGSWDARFLSLILASTVVDYCVGLGLATEERPARRRLYLLVSLVANLGILGFFKYCGFFVTSATELLNFLGFHPHVALLKIALPVGISFYTFQTLSYSIDVYRRRIQPTRDLLTFALFVAYFPQLVAGPIERASNLLPRLAAARKLSWPSLGVGVELILIGFVKKVGIADSIGPLVDLRFENPELASGSDLLLAAYLFAVQIYCDFSGYSDIARGVSKLFGIELMRNFEQPYLSRNITEFWRRWHISLSTWLRDYLYIPLGGNRKGVTRTYRNLMLTMLLGGLWHGASWTFVVWGGLHGTYLSVHKFMTSRWGRSEQDRHGGVWARLLGIAVTFHLVTLTWIYFRSRSFGDAWTHLTGIVTWRDGSGAISELSWISPKLLVTVLVMALIDVLQDRSGRHAVFLEMAWLRRGLVYATLVVLTLSMGGLSGQVPFIYFQF